MVSKLIDVVDLIAGYAFKSGDFGNYPDKVIKITQINPPLVDLKSATGVNLQKYNRSKLEKYIAKKGDFVLAMTGATIGKIGRIEEGEAYINQRVLMFKPKSNVDSDFIYYVLQSYEFSQYVLNHIDSESAQPNISANTIGNFEFDLPDIILQKKIGILLRNFDEKAELNRRINDNLLQQAFALFDNQFSDITAGSCSVSDYILPKRGRGLLSKDAIKGDVPVVAGGLEPATYHNAANTESPVITISASGANAGFIRLWNIPVWSSDSSFIDSSITDFVYFWFVHLKKRQDEIYGSQTGSAQPHIYPQNIGALPICELDISKVKQYNDLVTPLFIKIGANESENVKLAHLRDTLLPKLMAGEVDLDSLNV